MDDGADDVVGRYKTEGFDDGGDDGSDVGRYETEGFDDGVDVHDEIKGSQMG